MTRLTDEELRRLRDYSAAYGSRPLLLDNIADVFDELLALRAVRQDTDLALLRGTEVCRLRAELGELKTEVAQLRGADERAVKAVVRWLQDFGEFRMDAIADDVKSNWREWVAREGK